MTSIDHEKNESTAISSVPKVQSPSTITEVSSSRASATPTNASSQMQLLTLAKRFNLDGGLSSNEEQAPLEERARKRERIKYLRQQQNLEQIIQKTIAFCSKDKVADKPDHDWFSSFLELANGISNNTMQDLWAKILASEIAQPGSFSLKALEIFRKLSIHDAKLMAKVSKYVIKDKNKKNIRIITGSYQQPGLLNFFDKQRIQRINLNQYGLSYTDLLSLADNGLLFIQEAESHLMQINDKAHLVYNGLHLDISAKRKNCVLCFYKFTPVGNELLNLITDKPDDDFLATLKQSLSNHFSV